MYFCHFNCHFQIHDNLYCCGIGFPVKYSNLFTLCMCGAELMQYFWWCMRAHTNNLRTSLNLAIIQSWYALDKKCWICIRILKRPSSLCIWMSQSPFICSLAKLERSRGTAGNVHKSFPEAYPYSTRGSLPPHRLLSKIRSSGLHVNEHLSPATLAGWQKQHFCSNWKGVLNICSCKKCDFISNLKML